MANLKVYADFHNADAQGRIRLNCAGTATDLARHNIHLAPGLVLELYSDDADEAGNPKELHANGIVQFSEEEQGWVAAIEWNKVRQVPIKSVAKTTRKPSRPALRKAR